MLKSRGEKGERGLLQYICLDYGSTIVLLKLRNKKGGSSLLGIVVFAKF